MTVSIGLIYDQIRWEEKEIINIAKSRDITIKLIDCRKNFFDLTAKETEKVCDVVLQRCVSYFRNFHSTAILESQGYSVVNPLHVAQICGNKLLTTLTLANAGVPTPKTYVAFSREGALSALDELGYPAVLKPVVGSWGRLIAPLKDPETAEAIFEDREYMFPLYHVLYIQKMVKRPPRDIRVFVVGGEAVTGIYRYSFLDTKTNVAIGGKPEACKITDEIRELSLKAADAVGGGILGVDMMETEDGFVVHEVNHAVEFQATATTTRVSLPKYIVGYLIRKAKK